VTVAPLPRVGVTRSGVTWTGDTADGYRVITASRRMTARTPLSHFELGLIVAVLAVAVAVAVPEYLNLRRAANDDSARTRLAQATRALDEQQAAVGTYAGAVLPSGVVLRRSGSTSYCAETRSGGHVWHVSTGAKPAAGAC
jgi:Tfp pilus assembly protein PilE